MHSCLVCGILFKKVYGRPRCKDCHSLFRKEYYIKNKEEIRIKKKQYALKNAERAKEYSAIYRKENREDLLVKKKIYRANNLEKVKQGQRDHYLRNSDSVKKKAKEYAEKNKEKTKQMYQNYYDKNKEVIKENIKKWQINNPEKVKLMQRTACLNRVARKKNAKGKYTTNDISALYDRQNGCCVVCNVSLDAAYHVDHIVPLSRGGVNYPENLQLLCPSCNCQKSAMTMDEFLDRRKKAGI